MSQADFKFPSESVYVLQEGAKEFDMEVNKLYLQYREKNGPEWTFEDVACSYLSEETERSIFDLTNFSKPYQRPKIIMAIGEKECNEFKESQGSLFKLQLENLYRRIHLS